MIPAFEEFIISLGQGKHTRERKKAKQDKCHKRIPGRILWALKEE